MLWSGDQDWAKLGVLKNGLGQGWGLFPLAVGELHHMTNTLILQLSTLHFQPPGLLDTFISKMCPHLRGLGLFDSTPRNGY